uniref:Putative secreted protein n=1 Tax=Ixodes ricinus TaxID=34613 RepID=A0A6B0UC59_IXORI
MVPLILHGLLVISVFMLNSTLRESSPVLIFVHRAVCHLFLVYRHYTTSLCHVKLTLPHPCLHIAVTWNNFWSPNCVTVYMHIYFLVSRSTA